MLHLWKKSLALSVSLAACILSMEAHALVIYVGPAAKPHASGTPGDDPIVSLQAAIDRGLAHIGPEEKLEIRFKDGRYVAQQVVIRAPGVGNGGISIVRRASKGHRLFDGAGFDSPWLTAATDQCPFKGLTVYWLELRGYAATIALTGSRDVEANSVSDMLIRNNVFGSIGQTAKLERATSTAAVRLVNADRVNIAPDVFDGVHNRWNCGIIHSVYLAQCSTDNVIDDSAFKHSCGDATRLRDGYDKSRLKGSTFVDAWAESPSSDWYCDKSLVKGSTKKTPECPSLDNVLEGDKVGVKQARQPLPQTAHGIDAPASCPVPVNKAGAIERRRFAERG